MSDRLTPRTDAWRKFLIGCGVRFLPDKTLEFARELERELAEANSELQSLRAEKMEGWWVSHSDFLEYQSSKAAEIAMLQAQLDEAIRPAKLANPLHEVLSKMDLMGGSFVRSLADSIRNADPENQKNLMAAFRLILERYDSMIPTTHPETFIV